MSSFKAKDWVRRPVSQTSAVTMLRPKLYHIHIYWTGRPTNFRIGTLVEHATVTPSYKAMKLGSCTRADAYRVGHTRRPRSLLKSVLQFQSRHNSHTDTGHCYVIAFGAGKRLDVIITIMKHVQISVSCPPGKQKVGAKKFTPTFKTVAPPLLLTKATSMLLSY